MTHLASSFVRPAARSSRLPAVSPLVVSSCFLLSSASCFCFNRVQLFSWTVLTLLAMNSNSSFLSLETFRGAIEKAIEQRQRTYTHAAAISFRWEVDNTHAVEDVKAFQNIMRIFGFQPAKEIVISRTDISPAWTVAGAYRSVLQNCSQLPGRSIVFVHYAGHGTLIDGSLFIGNSSQKILSVERVFFGDLIDGSLSMDDSVDVVFILDCCYSYATTRVVTPVSRVVEVLAATSENTPAANPASVRASFSGELANELARRKGRGDASVELAEAIEALRGRASKIKPTHCLRLGSNSIRLCFPDASENSHLPQMPPSLSAVFSVHLSPTLPQEEIDKFVAWILHLPRSVALHLDSAYQTRSTLLIFRSSYSLFSKINGLPGIHFLCETRNPPLDIHGAPKVSNLQERKQENIPLGIRKRIV